MIDALRELNHPGRRRSPGRMSFSHCSILARDFAERLRQTNDRKDHFGRVLLIISPYSAYAMGTLVEADWDEVKDEVPAWRAKVGDAPALLGALGKKYVELKQYDEAEKYLKRYMELSADLWVYQQLAACYEARGDRERWKATLDDYLTKTEAAGLQHAQVQVQLANYLMKQGRWADAKKYAEPAAETWAALGDDLRLAVQRGTQGLGSGRALDAAHQRALSHVELGRLVPLLQADRPRRRRGGPSLRRGAPDRRRGPPGPRGAAPARFLLLVDRIAEEGARNPGEGVRGGQPSAAAWHRTDAAGR